MPKSVTINDVQNLTEEQLKALQRQAAINILTFVGIKIGIAVATHYAIELLLKKYTDD